MTDYRVNDAGVAKARSLIDANQYVLESSWTDEQPDAEDENADIDRHDWEQFGEWHLAIDPDASEETKERYGFPYGDFRRVHRSALIAAKGRAAQFGHAEVESAAAELLDHLDETAAD